MGQISILFPRVLHYLNRKIRWQKGWSSDGQNIDMFNPECRARGMHARLAYIAWDTQDTQGVKAESNNMVRQTSSKVAFVERW